MIAEYKVHTSESIYTLRCDSIEIKGCFVVLKRHGTILAIIGSSQLLCMEKVTI